MGMIATDGRSRFEHAKDQIRDQAAVFASQGYDMGIYIFSHRMGGCGDIELTVPMAASPGAQMDIYNAIGPLQPHGNTPLSKTIQVATQYIKDNHLDGTEVVVVSDGGDNCGGDPISAARDLYASTHSRINIIGMDIGDHELGMMQAVAQAGGGTFRREMTGAGEGPGGIAPAIQFRGPIGRGAPLRLPPRSPSPGTYTRGSPRGPQPDPAQAPGHGREGAPDDSKPIYDPKWLPSEVTFERSPPQAPKVPVAQPKAPPPAPPPPPQPPAPKPSEAAPELPATLPFLP
jgi:hypothetical protein